MKNIDVIDIIDDDIIFEDDTKQSKKFDNSKPIIIKIEKKKVKKTKTLEEEIKEIRSNIKQEEANRNKLLEEANNNLDDHSKRIIELNSKIKQAELTEVKYKSLENEYEQLEKIYKLKLEEYKILTEEVINLKKISVECEKKANMLKSILELLIKEYGVYEICEITRLTEDKINDYLK